MKVICAWCLATIKVGDEKNVSHGICRSCLDKANRNGMEASKRLGREQDEKKPIEHNG